MAAETVQNPPSLSKRLIRQWRWVGLAVVVVALAIMSRSVDASPVRIGGGDRCQVEVNADVLNVRAGAGADTASVDKLSRGDIVDALPEVTNGFRKLGDGRWVSTQFATPNGHCG